MSIGAGTAFSQTSDEGTARAGMEVRSDCGSDRPQLSLTTSPLQLSVHNAEQTEELASIVRDINENMVTAGLVYCSVNRDRTRHFFNLVRRVPEGGDLSSHQKTHHVEFRAAGIVFVGQRPLSYAEFEQVAVVPETGEAEYFELPGMYMVPVIMLDISGDPDFYKEHTTLKFPPVDAD